MHTRVLNVIALLPVSAVLMLVGQCSVDPHLRKVCTGLSLMALGLYGVLLSLSMLYQMLLELLEE